MDLRLMEDIMEAIHLAGRIVANLPGLPKPLKNGMLPVLCTLRRLQDEEGRTKVTDISKYLRLTSPGVIRLIGLCEKEGLVEKWRDAVDKRVVNIRLTEKGSQVLEYTLDQYHKVLAQQFSNFEDKEWETMVKLLRYSYDVMEEVSRQMNYQLPDWQQENVPEENRE